MYEILLIIAATASILYAAASSFISYLNKQKIRVAHSTATEASENISLNAIAVVTTDRFVTDYLNSDAVIKDIDPSEEALLNL